MPSKSPFEINWPLEVFKSSLKLVGLALSLCNEKKSGTHLGSFLIWAPDSFGSLTHLGPKSFGHWLIWALTHFGPNSFGPWQIWAPTHLGPDAFWPRLIWTPTHLGPNSFLSPEKYNFKISKSRFFIIHRCIFDYMRYTPISQVITCHFSHTLT